MEPRQAPGALRGRQVLVELLRPLGAADAEARAGALIAEFGTLAAALAAGSGAQGRVLGDLGAVRHLGAVREAMLHCLRSEALSGPILTDSRALIDYLFLDMGHLPFERLRVLYLDTRNRLLSDSVIADGSVDEVPLQPREILRRAIEVGATAMILVHNHPSGDPSPGAGDIEAARRMEEAADTLGICVHDHLIVTRSGWSSLRALGISFAA